MRVGRPLGETPGSPRRYDRGRPLGAFPGLRPPRSPQVSVLLASGEPPEGGLPEGCAGLVLKPFALGSVVARFRVLLPRP
jgi:hypothetical protein